MKANVKR
jgi:hypothetical protein